ncbi:hypothetical protein FGIG_01256 [Fasciola gigantica]|uniref:Uncharacterized protein n=1 Tax=Fasciola gigantica TaxID=46835 RepID=A0A504YFJ9_FASGI|nr:hypothetical protein FGIG_01256 [Fasciola gigantica]
MISPNRTDFRQRGSRIKLTTVGSLIYSYLIVYTLTRMQITGHVLHLVRDTTVQTPNTDSAQTVSIPYANTIARDDDIETVSKSLSRRRIANITSNITTSKPTTAVHVPFVSQWYTAYSDKGTTTTRTESSSGTRNVAEVNKQKYPTSRRIYSIVHEWERYQHQRQVVLQRQWMQVLRQQKRRQRRLEEYNRHLRHFASILTQQHLNQLRKARTFREFKEIMFDRNTLTTNTIDSDEDHSISSPEDNASHSLIESPLPYPVSGHTIVASASSALEFPGGAGGGIIVNSLRSSRKGSTRESRAIMEPPISISTEHLVTVSAKSKQMGPTQTPSNQRDDSVHHMSTGDEKSRCYATAQLETFYRTDFSHRTHIMRLSTPEHTTVVIPSGFYVRRCGTQIQPVCSYHAQPVPTEIGNENPDLEGMADGTGSDGLSHIDAAGSEGNLRTHWCKNRLCVSPLKLVIHTFSDCACVCPPRDTRCRQLLEGIGQFTPKEIPLPLNGSYILPPCQYGPMDDVHLYHRRCPQPIRRSVGESE